MTAERPVRNANFVFLGGSSGIGLAAAEEIGRRGGNVLIVGRNVDAGNAAVARVKAAGASSADFLSADLSTVKAMAAAAAGVKAWRSELHGVMHTAMAAFKGQQTTADGLEFAFALQYLARAVLNRLLADNLAASGDGRIVHIAGNVPAFFMPPLDDLQFQHRKWGFMKAILGTHLLGFLHIQDATQRWQDRPITLTAACVGTTKTKVMLDPKMPLFMRLSARFGVSPEVSARNAIQVLTAASARDVAGTKLPNPKRYRPELIALSTKSAAELWDITTSLAAAHGIVLP